MLAVLARIFLYDFFVDGYESRPDGAKIEISSIPVFSHSRVAVQVFAKSGISNAKKVNIKERLVKNFLPSFKRKKSQSHIHRSLSRSQKIVSQF